MKHNINGAVFLVLSLFVLAMSVLFLVTRVGKSDVVVVPGPNDALELLKKSVRLNEELILMAKSGIENPYLVERIWAVADEFQKRVDALEAENRALKAQLAQTEKK